MTQVIASIGSERTFLLLLLPEPVSLIRLVTCERSEQLQRPRLWVAIKSGGA